MPTRIKLAFGAAQFGSIHPLGAKVNTVEGAQKIVDLFVSYGNEKLDTARIYGAGTSEEFISRLELKGCTVDTKIYPGPAGGGFKAEKVKEMTTEAVQALGSVKIQTLYLHAPDGKTPLEETLRAVNDLHKEGLFEEFGLSNFNSWEVAEAVGIADKHGWVKPTVYQGLYNAIERTVEQELLPCLRHFGIRFYAYSPLASGVLSGRFLTEADIKVAGGRWDPNISFIAGTLFQKYTPTLPVLKELKDSLEKNNISLLEVAFRWLQHHSKLSPEAGDHIILGASNVAQLESNLKANEGGPLSEEIVALLDSAWSKALRNAAQLESNLKANEGGPLSEEIVALLDSAWSKVIPTVRRYAS